MRVSDLDRIKEIDAVAFTAEEQYGNAVYEQMLRSGRSFVEETLDGVLAGYVFVGAEREDSSSDAFGYVRSVAVHPDYRRRGYGRALLEAVIERGDRDIIAPQRRRMVL